MKSPGIEAKKPSRWRRSLFWEYVRQIPPLLFFFSHTTNLYKTAVKARSIGEY